ncbi:MAG: sulfotransferase family 2 domain-containing protein [Thermodesulfobacteriota bacterium]|nr:sulfotransferase family 2 domain-containing protein [Thermodesulfobacteriota bacterium]
MEASRTAFHNISYMIAEIKRKRKVKKSPVIHDNRNAIRIGAFISIPKNASKSVLDILELGHNRDEETTRSLVIYENHQRAAVLDRKYGLDNLFVFCFSRNPYDRCVSWFEYHKDIEPYKFYTFESWIKNGMPHHWDIQNQTNYAEKGLSPLLQYNFVENYKVDFIGQIENFSRDINTVIERLNTICENRGLRHRFQYTPKRVNTSERHTDLQHYYTKETREIVYAHLKQDFMHFGYAP